MDVTFEDVAQVIQDARYQQAIIEVDAAQPDRTIKLPRKFDVDKFFAENNITLKLMVNEPLGRWFLERFADVEEVGEGGRMRRNRDGKEHNFLNCIEEVYAARKRDPSSLIPIDELVAILEKYNMEKVFEQALEGGGGDVTYEQLRQQYEVGKQIMEEEVEEEQFDDDEARSLSESQDDETYKTQITTEEHRVHGTQQDTVEITEKYGTNRKNKSLMSATYTDTEGAGVPLNALNRNHSSRSRSVNEVLDAMFEEMCLPLYDEFMRDERVKEAYCKFKNYTLKPVSDKDMRYHRVLGQGAFGTVYGCMISHVGRMMAMKIMVKKKVKYKKAKTQVTAEKDALRRLAEHPSPYCMQLRYAYETADNFHMIIPLAIGGDLKYHLRNEKFQLDRARIYCAEVAYGLGHLHALGMIMRDLKPRNILLDSEGHCKISDFGLVADISDGKPIRGRAGTEGYWSPEVINGKPYSIDADWWSYGCCVFEIVGGINPFSCKHTKLPTRNDGTRSGRIKWTSDFPPSAKALVSSLLNMNPKERMGCRGEGVNEVMKQNMSFWKPVNLSEIKTGKHSSPWTPKRGNIYAPNQHEMLDNDEDANMGATIRKIKIDAGDMPKFDYYVDVDNHQRDVIKVIAGNTKIPWLKSDDWTKGQIPQDGSCCSVA